MAKAQASHRGDAILTDRLPVRCPACGKKDPTIAEVWSRAAAATVTRVSCSCQWSELYYLEGAR